MRPASIAVGPVRWPPREVAGGPSTPPAVGVPFGQVALQLEGGRRTPAHEPERQYGADAWTRARPPWCRSGCGYRRWSGSSFGTWPRRSGCRGPIPGAAD